MAIAKANASIQREPVQLAPQKGFGQVSWKTPIEKNAFEISVAEKADLLKAVAEAALKEGASFVDSGLFLVNEQKYFASTDGSYIDQDVHRIWPNATATVVDKTTGKFETRDGLSAPDGHGLGVPLGPAGRAQSPGPWYHLRPVLRHGGGPAGRGPARQGQAHRQVGRGRAGTTWCSIPATSGSPFTSRWGTRSSWTACWATRPTTPAPASPRSTSGRPRASSTAAST